MRELGLSAWAVAAPPAVATHDLDIPRIGYVHSWTRTQDEGWWRAALDTYGIPYTYFADQKLRDGNLRAKYDVLLMPHIGGSAVAQVNGMARTGNAPLPYKKTDATPNLAYLDSSDDIRGGMGIEGLAELVKFVQQGGLLVTEGSTATILPEYGLTSGITVEEPGQLFVRGSIVRAKITDAKSPIVYGYAGSDLPVYFNQSPVLNAGSGGGGGGRGAPPAGAGVRDEWRVRSEHHAERRAAAHPGVRARGRRERRSGGEPSAHDIDRAAAPGGRRAGRAAGRRGRRSASARRHAVCAAMPSELLLSGTLAGGQALAGRAAAVDARLGRVTSFCSRSVRSGAGRRRAPTVWGSTPS